MTVNDRPYNHRPLTQPEVTNIHYKTLSHKLASYHSTRHGDFPMKVATEVTGWLLILNYTQCINVSKHK